MRLRSQYIEKKALLSSIVLFILFLCSCSISPYNDFISKQLQLHKKYPLNVLVDYSEMENKKFFSCEFDRDCYLYIAFRGFGDFPCQSAFEPIFENVHCIYKRTNFLPSNYDLIIKLVPDISRYSFGNPWGIELNLLISYENKNGKVLYQDNIIGIRVYDNDKYDKYDRDDKYLSLSRAAAYAQVDAMNKIASQLMTHPNFIDDYVSDLALIKRKQLEKKTLPANLSAEVYFSDKLSCIPNNTIDAAESSTINLTITNKGKGTAFDVKLATQSNYQNIEFPQIVSVGDIQPGESKKVNVDLKADLNLQNGTASFLIQAK
ncbi:hypothetical protein GMMP1_920026 [Candidatus Magnetomoraceae bacterium gMMP-1]